MNKIARNVLTKHIVAALKVLIEEYENASNTPREFEYAQAIGCVGQKLVEISYANEAKAEVK